MNIRKIQFQPVLPWKLLILFGVYFGMIYPTSLWSMKSSDIYSLVFKASMFCVILAMGLVDVVNEVWGHRAARTMALAVIVARVATLFGTTLVMALPTHSMRPGITEEMYAKFADGNMQNTLASLATMFVGTFLIDVGVFSWFKKNFKSSFWVRYNASNFVSQMCAEVVYQFASKLWVVPVAEIVRHLGDGLLVKLAAGMAFTPIVVLIVKWAKNEPILPTFDKVVVKA